MEPLPIKNRKPKFRGRWNLSSPNHHRDHLAQSLEDVVPDLGFSTASIARRRERNKEQNVSPQVWHDIPDPAPTPIPAPAEPSPTPAPAEPVIQPE